MKPTVQTRCHDALYLSELVKVDNTLDALATTSCKLLIERLAIFISCSLVWRGSALRKDAKNATIFLIPLSHVHACASAA
jgi:hypothetical protein